MAVWQFNVAFVPRSWIDSGGEVGLLVAQEGLSLAWRGYSDPRLEASLSRALSRGKSWHADLTLWGNAEADHIQLWRKQGKVQSVQVHFDLRNPNMALFQGVVSIARELSLSIVVPGVRRLLPLDVPSLLRAAAESDAAHFVVDPESFLLQAQAANAIAT